MASCSIERYVPSGSLAPYREVMNSPTVQADLLARARKVASTASADGIECTADVRAGRKRAHARATAKLTKATDFRSHGHNRKVDRALLAALDEAR
jgi:hypothetical protein